MKLTTLIGVIVVTIFLSCCLHETEGFGKLGLLKLIKAGFILKALSPKKILLPIPLPIPIGIHKESHHHDDYHHGGYQPHYGGGGGGYHSYGGHGGFGYHSGSGYHLETGGHWW